MINKNCFDFLRFFFAFDIFLAHLCELSQSKSLSFLSFFSNSAIAVKGFFIISGFLVAKSFATTPSLKEYFIKRAKRILPAYVFVILFCTIILVFFSSNHFLEYFSNKGIYQYVGWNLIFLNFMHPCLPGLFEDNLLCAVNGALWTLKVEEGFYIILPFIFYAIKRTKKSALILGSLYVFSLVYRYTMDSYFNQPLLAKQLPGYLSYFVTGIFLFLNFNFIMQNRKMFFLMSFLFLVISHFTYFQIDIFYPAGFGLLVIILAYNLSFFNNFGKYGDFTYGLYIYHFPIIQLFRQYDLFEEYNPILMATVVVLITILFAIFSWFFIEKRFLDRFKNSNTKIIPSYVG